MSTQDRHDLFTELVTRHQSELYAYIFAIVRDWEDASDLLQSVCLILWRKFESFQPGTSFFAWARQIAQLEVRNYLRRKRPSPYVSEELLDALAGAADNARSDRSDLYLTALRHCKAKLGVAEEQLLRLRYVENLTSGQIADRIRRPLASVCRSLKRIRGSLFRCIQADVARQERAEEGRP